MKCEFAAIITLCIVRCCRFGFRYFPVIDDWIQYISYQSAPDLFNRWFIGAGLYYTRPLAALMDLYVWGKIGVTWSFFIITLLHGVSCCLFLYVFRQRGIRAGLGFTVIYMLLPINTEGTMWLSASTRIVFSLFLISVSLLFLEKHKILFWLFNLISLFFYEQTAILSLAISLYFAHRERVKIIPLINGLIFALYYMLFSGAGPFGGRSTIVFPNTMRLYNFFANFAEGFFIKHGQLIVNGALRGFQIFRENYFLYVIAVILGIWVVLTAKRENGRGSIFLGIVLFTLPLLPYLFISQPFSFRAFMPSLVGLGIMTDGLLKSHNIKAVLSMFVIPIFLAVGISELTDYRSVSIADKKMAEAIIYDDAKSFKRVESAVELNVLYMQHITNVSESDWAMTGCVRALTENPDYPMLICEE